MKTNLKSIFRLCSLILLTAIFASCGQEASKDSGPASNYSVESEQELQKQQVFNELTELGVGVGLDFLRFDNISLKYEDVSRVRDILAFESEYFSDGQISSYEKDLAPYINNFGIALSSFDAKTIDCKDVNINIEHKEDYKEELANLYSIKPRLKDALSCVVENYETAHKQGPNPISTISMHYMPLINLYSTLFGKTQSLEIKFRREVNEIIKNSFWNSDAVWWDYLNSPEDYLYTLTPAEFLYNVENLLNRVKLMSHHIFIKNDTSKSFSVVCSDSRSTQVTFGLIDGKGAYDDGVLDTIAEEIKKCRE